MAICQRTGRLRRPEAIDAIVGGTHTCHLQVHFSPNAVIRFFLILFSNHSVCPEVSKSRIKFYFLRSNSEKSAKTVKIFMKKIALPRPLFMRVVQYGRVCARRIRADLLNPTMPISSRSIHKTGSYGSQNAQNLFFALIQAKGREIQKMLTFS